MFLYLNSLINLDQWNLLEEPHQTHRSTQLLSLVPSQVQIMATTQQAAQLEIILHNPVVEEEGAHPGPPHQLWMQDQTQRRNLWQMVDLLLHPQLLQARYQVLVHPLAVYKGCNHLIIGKLDMKEYLYFDSSWSFNVIQLSCLISFVIIAGNQAENAIRKTEKLLTWKETGLDPLFPSRRLSPLT